MNNQPTALQLADELAVFATWRDDSTETLGKSAAELRRLHEANQAMLEALKEVFSLEESLLRDIWGCEFVEKASAAIAKGEQA